MFASIACTIGRSTEDRALQLASVRCDLPRDLGSSGNSQEVIGTWGFTAILENDAFDIPARK
jgi:hypothetical protein